MLPKKGKDTIDNNKKTNNLKLKTKYKKGEILMHKYSIDDFWGEVQRDIKNNDYLAFGLDSHLLISKNFFRSTSFIYYLNSHMIIFGLKYASTLVINFNCNDCSGNNHDLFTELDEGKIIVIAWVMPCGGCVNPAKTAYNKVQTYSTSNPSQVFFYLVDDYANTSCSSLTGWASANSMPNAVVFSNATIDMSDYGTDGMPKIVVLGGSDHKIYYNVNTFSDGIGVQAAIDSALSESTFGIAELSTNNFQLSVSPNPSNKKEVSLSYSLSETQDVTIEIINPIGEKVETFLFKQQPKGNNQQQLDVSELSSGIYIVKLSAGNRVDEMKIVVGE
jgi:hypothetical protein